MSTVPCNRTTGQEIRLQSLDYDTIVRYRRHDSPPRQTQLALVQAVVNRLDIPPQGFSLLLKSDAPPGSGLGSSSAMVVMMLGLFRQWLGLLLSDQVLAELAYEIERHDMQIVGGKQDQFAAAFGGFNLIDFARDGTYVTPLRLGTATLNELECNLLLCFTGSAHPEGEILADQVASYTRRRGNAICRAGSAQGDHHRHETGPPGRQGQFLSAHLLHEAWLNKRKLARGITTDRIDKLYGLAAKQGRPGRQDPRRGRRRLSAALLPVRPEAPGGGRPGGGRGADRAVQFRQPRDSDMAGSLTALRRLALDARPVQSARGTGIGSYTSQLLKALDRVARLNFHLVWSPGEPRPLLRNGAEYWPLGKDDLLEQTALPAWLAQTGAQVYHLTQNGLGWPRRSPIPLVLTLHDLIPYRLPEVVRPSYLTRFLTEVPGAVAAARRIITVSEAARADICGIFGTDPAKVVAVPSAPAAVFHPRNRRRGQDAAGATLRSARPFHPLCRRLQPA